MKVLPKTDTDTGSTFTFEVKAKFCKSCFDIRMTRNYTQSLEALDNI